MAVETKAEEKKFIKYWLKHTEAPIVRATLGTGAVEVTIGDVTETSYWYHESLGETANPFVDDEITTGKDCKGVVDEEFWTATDEDTYKAANSATIRKDAWQINVDKETDSEGLNDIEYTHEYSWSTYDGTKDVEYRVAGICQNCKNFKPNTELLKSDKEQERTSEENADTEQTTDEITDEVSTQKATEEETKEPGITEKKKEKTGDDYWVHHEPHKCHRFDWRKVCKDGMCTRYKKTDYITGKEMNENCHDRNYYGECTGFEWFEQEEVSTENENNSTESVITEITPTDKPTEPTTESEPTTNGDGDD